MMLEKHATVVIPSTSQNRRHGGGGGVRSREEIKLKRLRISRVVKAEKKWE
jgi:hypothetical protein